MSRMMTKRGRETMPSLRDMDDWDDLVSRMFGRSMRWPLFGDKELLTEVDWVPPVDIEETPERFIVKAELPGIEKKDLDVSIDHGVLCIRGERKNESESKGKKFHRIERTQGMFMRSFTLPSNVDEKHLHAEYRDGLLTVALPKSTEEKASKKTIEVK